MKKKITLTLIILVSCFRIVFAFRPDVRIAPAPAASLSRAQPHFAIATNPLGLIIKALPVVGYVRTGIVVHQVRYCKFYSHNTDAFYNVFPVRGAFSKLMSFPVKNGYEADYFMKFLLGTDKMSDDNLIAGTYIGLGYQIAQFQLAEDQYWAYDNATPSAEYFFNASPVFSSKSIQGAVGFMLMMKHGLFVDIDMTFGGRTRDLDFNVNSPVSGEEITTQNTTFKDDHLIIPDTFTPGHYYKYLMGHFRFGFSF